MLTFLLPDRLPGLIVLVGFWIPPAMDMARLCVKSKKSMLGRVSTGSGSDLVNHWSFSVSRAGAVASDHSIC